MFFFTFCDQTHESLVPARFIFVSATPDHVQKCPVLFFPLNTKRRKTSFTGHFFYLSQPVVFCRARAPPPHPFFWNGGFFPSSHVGPVIWPTLASFLPSQGYEKFPLKPLFDILDQPLVFLLLVFGCKGPLFFATFLVMFGDRLRNFSRNPLYFPCHQTC